MGINKLRDLLPITFCGTQKTVKPAQPTYPSNVISTAWFEKTSASMSALDPLHLE